MAKPMNIGLVTPGWPGHNTPNGIATAVYHLAMGLKDIGHNPVILAIEIDGEPPQGIPVIKINRRPWKFWEKVKSRLGVDMAQETFAESLADGMEEASEAHGLDVIVIEETHGWAAKLIQRKTLPVVVFLHGPWLLHKAIQSDGNTKSDTRRETQEARAICNAAALISPSQNVMDAVEAELDVAHLAKAVIANSYAAPKPAALPKTGPILFVGRFDFHKGGDTVVEAFRSLHRKKPDTRLTFAGPDRGVRHPDGTSITMPDAVAELPQDTQKALSVLGRQTTDQVAQLRRSHPIAVIASRYENLNYTMLEAMAAGQAIVSTRVGGPAEVFEDEKTALLVPPDDPEAMANALQRLCADPELATRLGTAARAQLEDKFHPNVIAGRMIDFLQPVLNGDTARNKS